MTRPSAVGWVLLGVLSMGVSSVAANDVPAATDVSLKPSAVGRVCGRAPKACLRAEDFDALRVSLGDAANFRDLAQIEDRICAVATDGRCACTLEGNARPCGKDVARVAVGGITYQPRRDDTGMDPPGGRPRVLGSVCTLSVEGKVRCDARGMGVSSPWDGTFIDLAAGISRTCALTLRGSAVCTRDGSGPFIAEGPSTALTRIAVGNDFACALDAEGLPHCWSHQGRELPAAPQLPLKDISCGHYHACGLTLDDRIVCWGDNTYGQSRALDGQYEAVAAIDDRSCARAKSGAVECWGWLRHAASPTRFVKKLVAEVRMLDDDEVTAAIERRDFTRCKRPPRDSEIARAVDFLVDLSPDSSGRHIAKGISYNADKFEPRCLANIISRVPGIPHDGRLLLRLQDQWQLQLRLAPSRVGGLASAHARP